MKCVSVLDKAWEEGVERERERERAKNDDDDKACTR
jgi:hypothetical protein